MRIRNAQFSAFDEARLPGFDDFIVDHFRSFTPLHFDAMGEPAIRSLAKEGLSRANGYGFTKRGPVRLFTEMLILLGYRFDTDPQYPWAAQILNEQSDDEEVARADRLWEKLMDLLNAIRGPDQQFVSEALRRCRLLNPSAFDEEPNDFQAELIHQMKIVFPQKASFIGDQCLADIIGRARVLAEEWQLADNAGVSLFAACIFGMGHGFIDDPKNPWVKRTLEKNKSSSPRSRIERLYSKLMVYLEEVLNNLEAGRM